MQPEILDDGLIMRNASVEDMPSLLDHFRTVHGAGVEAQLTAMLEKYPRFSWEDSFIIADQNSGEVVSCILLLQNSWILDGVEVPSVEMEAVGTLKAYRYRGHIRLLNQEFEKRAAQLNPAIQAIAGIPFFYREFGYEYAANLGGGYPINPNLIPNLKDGEEESVTFNLVTSKNFKEFLSYREKHIPSKTWTRKIRPEDASYLIYETTSLEQEAFFFYLVKEKGKTVGVFILSRWTNRLDIVELYLENHLFADAVMRFALAKAHEWDGMTVRMPPPNQKQVREFVSARNQVITIPRYAWCIKIPSIPRFIETIGPLLSNRLSDTEFRGFTGELAVTTYKQGYSIKFENGAFQSITERGEKDPGEYNLRIPKGSLTRLLMGYETLDELMKHEPDVYCASVSRPIVRNLFPRFDAVVDPYY